MVELKIKLFADGADRDTMIALNNNPFIAGMTTNPSLMRKAGVMDYKAFALDVLSVIKTKPISFEVFSDDLDEMYQQALEIASWGENVYVKIPVTNTLGFSTHPVVCDLIDRGVKLNITAITTVTQVSDLLPFVKKAKGLYISVFAGRIADTGVCPVPIIKSVLKLIKTTKNDTIELIWASTRELLNVIQADRAGCHIITCTTDIIKKLPLLGKDLTEYSLETVKMFYKDGEGFKI
jgi:transaldolase